MKRIAAGMMIGLVKAYQIGISSWIPARCRFLPTCSEYAIEAVKTHGACRGGALALQRLLRCHPWGGSGLDPVPPLSSSSPPKACCTHHESESR